MKNKTFWFGFLLILTFALCLGLTSLTFAAESDKPAALPDSVLYYGKLEEILQGEDGKMSALRLTSERYGEYVMRLSENTVWIDSGKRSADDVSDLETGEGLYIFHSAISTRSNPPQSVAFAIVRNVPQDASCPHYHKVEFVEQREDGGLQITTDNGGLFILADTDTTVLAYQENSSIGLDSIKVGEHIMAWYESYAAVYPGQTRASHIMRLNSADEDMPLKRSSLAVMLHKAQGSPLVNVFVNFSDVDQEASYAEAIRWAVSEGITLGYGDGKIGPDDFVTREQLAVILWRQAGSPMLMDYPGLTNYSDVGDISRFAQPALAWAHQKGLLPERERLAPQDTVTLAEAEKMLAALGE